MPYNSAEKPSPEIVNESIWDLKFIDSRWQAFCKFCDNEDGLDPYSCKRHESRKKHQENVALVVGHSTQASGSTIGSSFAAAMMDPRANETSHGIEENPTTGFRPTKYWVARTRILESFLAPDIPRSQLPDVVDCEDDEYTQSDSSQEFLSSYAWDELAGTRLDDSEESIAAQRLAEHIRSWNLDPDGVNGVDSDDEAQEIEIEPEVRLAEDPEQSEEELEEAMGRKRMRTALGESDARWFPWVDRLDCSLDLLMHLPRSVFSERQLELFRWLLEVNGIDDVPSVKSTKDANDALQKLYGIQTFKYQGAFGHVYYVNSLADIISQEMSNPLVRPKLAFYPEVPGSAFSQARHGNKWMNEIPDEELTPMVRLKRGQGHQDFYIFEPAMLRDGSICMPHRWIRRDGKFLGRCWKMKEIQKDDGTGSWRVLKNEHLEVTQDNFLYPFTDLRDLASRGYGFTTEVSRIDDYYEPWSDTFEKWTLTDPSVGNPWRTRARGHQCLAFPIWLFCDDTSGNKSKKWNEHNSFLFTPAGLDRSECSKEFNIHFLCTSNCAPPLEMLDGIADQLCDGQENGIWAWDIESNEPVLLLPSVLALLGDNPMQSEFACHIGLRGKFFCRCCKCKGKDSADGREEVRGDSDDSESEDEGDLDDTASNASATGTIHKRKRRKRYVEAPAAMTMRVNNFVHPGVPRTKEETLRTLDHHFCTAKTVSSETACTNVRRESGIKDTYQMFFVNKLIQSYKHRRGAGREAGLNAAIEVLPERATSSVWRIRGLNPHSDTPVEVLHVVLLGFVKYLWRDVIKNQLKDKADKKAILSARLSSVWVEGLGLDSLLAGNTLVNYYGSLTGGDFRKLSQVAPFVLHDLVSSECYDTWLALSKLVPLIWQPEIVDLDAHLATLTQEIQNFLVLSAKWSIRWFNKPKFHILVHLPEHIRRFGPAALFATETFESFNAVIREKSVHSNRHAPSHDLAVAFAAGNRIRHLTSGGKFLQVAELTEMWTEDEINAGVDFEDASLPQSRRITRVQRYFRKHIPSASHWASVGPGPRSLLSQSQDTLGRYLGLAPTKRDKLKARAFTCTFDKSVPASCFSDTETGRKFPDLDRFSSDARRSNLKHFRVAKEMFLANGDRCSVSTEPILRKDKQKFSSASPFIIFRREEPEVSLPTTPSFPTPQMSLHRPITLHLARATEILQYAGDNALAMALAVNADCILAQIYCASREPSVSGMPRLTAQDESVVLEPKEILCTVNVQHDCIRNECAVKDIHFRRQERHVTSLRKGAVEHKGDLHDIVLNTAQMRDARYVQRFRIPPVLLDTASTLAESVKKEVESRKRTSNQSRRNSLSNTPRVSPSSTLASRSQTHLEGITPDHFPSYSSEITGQPGSAGLFLPMDQSIPTHYPPPDPNSFHDDFLSSTQTPFFPAQASHWPPYPNLCVQSPGTPYTDLGNYSNNQITPSTSWNPYPHTTDGQPTFSHHHMPPHLSQSPNPHPLPNRHRPLRPSSLRQSTLAPDPGSAQAPDNLGQWGL